MFKRIDHVEIIPRNAERTIRFYTDILGFQVISREAVNAPPLKEVIYLRLGDTTIEVMSVDDPKPGAESPWQIGLRAIALEVEDMAKAVEYLKTRGISMSLAPVDLGNSYRGELRDPDGLIIELRQWK
ncbi:MAG TPA: VOC family protein [Kiritimatiellia bacterium]|jgi:catechol 2,3-dioxygenase-like lactoylglutathione lyase family enzyme|nr:MAG: putative lyase [Verrucomicrobia bacterium ADurb.Bin018]HOD99514.1 VOC family protein [Kiritimatiellia bacterium]HOE36929.1 VOC family protein [Kiritimatiellia bacterium]HOR73435.1 VOC family protein [Kiritimatiellia bacterium]HOU58528.1 VOC family protein [Kiritimatiellia bacterium]